MTVEMDHVVFCVADLNEAARQLEVEHGLSTVAGGRHTGHGTANRIAPLGSAYLELVAVVDEEEAGSTTFGRWVVANASSRLKGHGICLRTDDLDAICERLGLEPTAMSRQRADGKVLRWRLAGLERMITERLPFFIEWEVSSEDHPGRATLDQASEETSIEATITGAKDYLIEWTSGAKGLSVSDGQPTVASVTVHTADGTTTL